MYEWKFWNTETENNPVWSAAPVWALIYSKYLARIDKGELEIEIVYHSQKYSQGEGEDQPYLQIHENGQKHGGYGDRDEKLRKLPGTYTMAITAKYHDIPFYVAAPMSTIDMKTNPEDIVIEERSKNEVRMINGEYITVPTAKVYNPAFDTTPPELVNAIITDRGILKQPNEEKMRKLFEQ